MVLEPRDDGEHILRQVGEGGALAEEITDDKVDLMGIAREDDNAGVLDDELTPCIRAVGPIVGCCGRHMHAVLALELLLLCVEQRKGKFACFCFGTRIYNRRRVCLSMGMVSMSFPALLSLDALVHQP